MKIKPERFKVPYSRKCLWGFRVVSIKFWVEWRERSSVEHKYKYIYAIWLSTGKFGNIEHSSGVGSQQEK